MFEVTFTRKDISHVSSGKTDKALYYKVNLDDQVGVELLNKIKTDVGSIFSQPIQLEDITKHIHVIDLREYVNILIKEVN